jgi:thioredoxin-dependent peroxiredoxin
MTELKVGDPAPNFEAQNQEGETVRLSDLQGKRVVLYFYPKDNTPGCTTQACGFRDHYPAFGEKNAVVLGVSPDSAKSHQKFQAKFSLPFPLLVDTDHQLAEQFGVWRQKKLAGHVYMGVVRSHFVIDEQGKLADVRYDVKAAQSPELALGALG